MVKHRRSKNVSGDRFQQSFDGLIRSGNACGNTEDRHGIDHGTVENLTSTGED